MDKTERKVIDFMLNSTYTDVIHRSITGYLSIAMNEIRDTIKLDSKWLANELAQYPVSQHVSIIVQLKEKAFLGILATDSCKKSLLWTVTETAKKRSDIIWEIMKQFGIDKGTDINYLHQQMETIFDRCVRKVRICIQQGKWKELFKKWEDI